MRKREPVRGIVISNTCVKSYRNWIINEVARAGEHTNERTYVRTYVLTLIRTGQTLYPLHNFVVRGDNNISLGSKVKLMRSLVISIFLYACESWTLTAELEKKSTGFLD